MLEKKSIVACLREHSRNLHFFLEFSDRIKIDIVSVWKTRSGTEIDLTLHVYF